MAQARYADDVQDPYRDPNNWNLPASPTSEPASADFAPGSQAYDTGYDPNAGGTDYTDPNGQGQTTPPSTSPPPVTGPNAGYQTDWGGGNTDQQNRQIQDTYGVGAPEGYDATKWQDQSHQTDKYLAGHIQAAGGNIDDVVHALAARTPGWKKVSNDVIEAPDGSRFDLRRDSSGVNAIQWQQVALPGGKPMPTGGGGGAGAQGGAGGPGPMTPEQMQAFVDLITHGKPLDAGGASSDLRTQMEAALKEFIAANQGGIGDVHTSPEAQAFQNQNQRNAEYVRSAMAERLGAEGLGGSGTGDGSAGSGALDSQVLGIAQSQGENQSHYEATLAHTLLTEKADRLKNALQLGAGYLSEQQRFMLQQQLQQTNAALEMYRLQLQNQQFYDDLGYRIGKTEGDYHYGGSGG